MSLSFGRGNYISGQGPLRALDGTTCDVHKWISLAHVSAGPRPHLPRDSVVFLRAYSEQLQRLQSSDTAFGLLSHRISNVKKRHAFTKADVSFFFERGGACRRSKLSPHGTSSLPCVSVTRCDCDVPLVVGIRIREVMCCVLRKLQKMTDFAVRSSPAKCFSSVVEFCQ